MNIENKKHITLKYVLKEGTKNSYRLQDGPTGYLPNRLSIIIGKTFAPFRAPTKNRIGQLASKYKKGESGLYKNLNGGTITSSIYSPPDNFDTTGYSVLDERNGIFDLWIINTTDQGLSFQLDLYKDQARNERQIRYCFSEIKKNRP